jgi:hypothetical protein
MVMMPTVVVESTVQLGLRSGDGVCGLEEAWQRR